MSDWLINDDNNGYLGLDDPPMPDAALTPPSDPSTSAAAPSLDDAWGSSSNQNTGDDWLGGNDSTQQSHGAPVPGQSVGGAPISDGQGDWLGGDSTFAAPAQPSAPAAYTPTHSPVAVETHENLFVSSPQLPDVAPHPRSMGGTRGELSNLVLDVEVQVDVGLGNAALTVEEFLEMGRGSVVELDTPVDSLIELKVRGKLIARGQLVSINGAYGMRIVEMLTDEN